MKLDLGVAELACCRRNGETSEACESHRHSSQYRSVGLISRPIQVRLEWKAYWLHLKSSAWLAGRAIYHIRLASISEAFFTAQQVHDVDQGIKLDGLKTAERKVVLHVGSAPGGKVLERDFISIIRHR